MIMNKISLEQAVAEGMQMPFAYVRSFSAVTLGKTQPLPPMNEILEARFFGPDQEIRLTDDGDGLYGLRIVDGETSDFIDLTDRLLSGFGKTLTKRSYVDFDEDGQGSIVCTRLLDWEG